VKTYVFFPVKSGPKEVAGVGRCRGTLGLGLSVRIRRKFDSTLSAK
jgi:hypothetical protein